MERKISYRVAVQNVNKKNEYTGLGMYKYWIE
jgi:hypothetical protein